MRRALAFVLALALAAAVGPAGAVHGTGSAFVVELDADGDATVSLVDEYDRSNGSQRATFEAIRGNETRQSELAAAVTERLRDGAANAAAATGREMAVSEATVNVTSANDTGVVRVRARWTGLAAVNPDDGYVEVTEPFASGFAVDRTLVVRGPPEFERAPGGTDPPPDLARKNAAFWGDQQDLSGFRARFAGPVATPTSTVAPVTGAGLSALANAASLALVPALLLLLALGRVER